MYIDILNSANMASNILTQKMAYYSSPAGIKILVYDYFPSINNQTYVPASYRNINEVKTTFEYVNGYLNQSGQGLPPVSLLSESDYELQLNSFVTQLTNLLPGYEVITKNVKEMYNAYKLASIKEGIVGVVGIDVGLLFDATTLFTYVPPEGVNIILDKESYIRALNRTFVTVSFSQAAYNMMYEKYLTGMGYDVRQYGEPILEDGLYNVLKSSTSIQDLSNIIGSATPPDITVNEISDAVKGEASKNPILYQRFSLYLDNMRMVYGIRDNVALPLLAYHPLVAGVYQHRANKTIGIDISETYVTNYYTIDRFFQREDHELAVYNNPDLDQIRGL